MRQKIIRFVLVAADMAGWVILAAFLVGALGMLGPSLRSEGELQPGTKTANIHPVIKTSRALQVDEPGVVLSGAISPDGSRAVVSVLGSGGERVELVSAAEGTVEGAEAPVRLHVDSDLSWRTVRWSPGGDQLAVRMLRAKTTQRGNDYLRITDLEGQLVANVVTSTHGVGWFEWSPDGDRIAYVSPKGQLLVYTVSAATSITIMEDVVTPAGGGGAYVAWAPDSCELALGTEPGIGRGNLFLVDVLTGVVTQITHFDGYRMPDPVWSPSGDMIAFFISDEKIDSSPELWVVRPDGRELRRVLVLPEQPEVPFSYAGYPLWLPYSSKVIFVWDNELWAIDVDGSGLEPLLDGIQVPAAKPSASADGSRLFLLTGLQGTDTPLIVDVQ